MDTGEVHTAVLQVCVATQDIVSNALKSSSELCCVWLLMHHAFMCRALCMLWHRRRAERAGCSRGMGSQALAGALCSRSDDHLQQPFYGCSGLHEPSPLLAGPGGREDVPF